MSQKDKFTFRQALLNVTIACSIVVGLGLSNGTEFYSKTENLLVVLAVIITCAVALIVKWREEKGKDNEKK